MPWGSSLEQIRPASTTVVFPPGAKDSWALSTTWDGSCRQPGQLTVPKADKPNLEKTAELPPCREQSLSNCVIRLDRGRSLSNHACHEAARFARHRYCTMTPETNFERAHWREVLGTRGRWVPYCIT